MSNSIKSLEPINIPCGWFVKYHDLTVTQETVEPNTKLIELEKQRYHAAVKIIILYIFVTIMEKRLTQSMLKIAGS